MRSVTWARRPDVDYPYPGQTVAECHPTCKFSLVTDR